MAPPGLGVPVSALVAALAVGSLGQRSVKRLREEARRGWHEVPALAVTREVRQGALFTDGDVALRPVPDSCTPARARGPFPRKCFTAPGVHPHPSPAQGTGPPGPLP